MSMKKESRSGKIASASLEEEYRDNPQELLSSYKKNLLEPGSPCLPARPRSWLSMRRASCRSVPTT